MQYEETARTRSIQREIFGKEFEGKSLRLLDPDGSITEKLHAWMKNPKHILLYQGGFGIGKTSLCAALVPWIVPTFGSCRFWTENLLLSRLRERINDGCGDYLAELKYCLDDKFVVFDDFGSSGANDWRREVITALVDNRWASELPTIITTNLTEDQILEQYHGRIHSRLFDARNTILEDRESYDKRTNRQV